MRKKHIIKKNQGKTPPICNKHGLYDKPYGEQRENYLRERTNNWYQPTWMDTCIVGDQRGEVLQMD